MLAFIFWKNQKYTSNCIFSQCTNCEASYHSCWLDYVYVDGAVWGGSIRKFLDRWTTYYMVYAIAKTMFSCLLFVCFSQLIWPTMAFKCFYQIHKHLCREIDVAICMFYIIIGNHQKWLRFLKGCLLYKIPLSQSCGIWRWNRTMKDYLVGVCTLLFVFPICCYSTGRLWYSYTLFSSGLSGMPCHWDFLCLN